MTEWTTQGGAAPQQSTRDNEVNFSLGQPTPRLLPIEAIAQAAKEILTPSTDNRLILQYGRAQGHLTTRKALSEFLSKRHKISIDPNHLMISAGNSSALGILCSSLRGNSTTAFVEDPTYLYAPDILKTHGIQPIGIPVDEDGLCVDLLEDQLRRSSNRPAFLYCIPTYHNPTGRTLSPSRRQKLLSLAAEHKLPIIADEPYNLLHFGSKASPPLASEPNAEWVISLGSFSKILGPGLRLGWIQSCPRWIQTLLNHGEIASGGALNPVIGAIVQRTIASGFLDEHVDLLRKTLADRARVLHQALQKVLPTGFIKPADGGYFLWPQLPHGLDDEALLETSKSRLVRFTPGSRCGGPKHRQFIRLSFSFYEAEELVEGAKRLATAIQTCVDEQAQ